MLGATFILCESYKTFGSLEFWTWFNVKVVMEEQIGLEIQRKSEKKELEIWNKFHLFHFTGGSKFCRREKRS